MRSSEGKFGYLKRMDSGVYTLPGFVDLQVNGFMGVDFSSGQLTKESFLTACRGLMERGTVAFLPTIITSSPERFERNLSLMASMMDHEELSGHLLGFHVEGPFLSPEEGAIGAHNPAWVLPPDPLFLDQLQEWAGGQIRLITIAAEREGAEHLCRHAVKQGISVSLGHQLANGEQMQQLADAGATALTHLGNGMPAQVNRHRNPLVDGLACDDLTAMVISDGHHLPESLLKVIWRVKGIDRFLVVSDASPIAGRPPGRYNTLGNEVVLEPSGYLWNPESGYLVGSSATMLECMNVLADTGWFGPEALLRAGVENPLRLIGYDPERVMNPFVHGIGVDKRFFVL
ncbi:MAG: N-acetylglucosamine-6-phosphate deacetylase [Bacteroidota bacterium]